MATLSGSHRIESGRRLPPAGPGVEPQLVEVLVGPWSRISVLFRATHVDRSQETGATWYWRPETVVRLDQSEIAA